MIDKFQTNFEVISLLSENSQAADVTKVGVLPFVPGDPWKLLLMKPRAEAKVFGPPAFQICKGTRRINISGSWCDMREEDLQYADESFHESLLATALREGQEEIGLKAENIHKLYDLGKFTFISASRGLIKPLHMYAAEIKDADDFLPFEATTMETSWMSIAEFKAVGRPDHVQIMQGMMKRLADSDYYKSFPCDIY